MQYKNYAKIILPLNINMERIPFMETAGYDKSYTGEPPPDPKENCLS